MAKVKKPKLIETVGALYYCFLKAETDADNITSEGYEEEIVKSPVIKNVSVEPEEETAVVRASGENYDEVSQTSSVGLEFELVAFDPADLAKAKGETVDEGGLISGGAANERPYIAIGYPVKKRGGGVQFKWYPKCKITEHNEEVATSEESYSEQNPTVNLSAYAFNEKGEKFVYVDSETENFPKGMTEDLFFSKVIITKEDLSGLIPGA